MLRTPPHEWLRDRLRPICRTAASPARHASPPAFQHLAYAHARQRCTDLDRQRIPNVFIVHIQRPVALPVVVCVADEVERLV